MSKFSMLDGTHLGRHGNNLPRQATGDASRTVEHDDALAAWVPSAHAGVVSKVSNAQEALVHVGFTMYTSCTC